ncbi:MAG: acyl-CoA thioesterase [Paracoccaceae bacterium]
MYPFVRMAWQMWRHRADPPLPIDGTHVSHHVCWPWDLDVWAELNNGRTLTLFDLGRYPLGMRTGLFAALRRRGWGLTVAGSSTRYRRRVTVMARLRMTSRCVGWDDRFLYIEQAMWDRTGACCSHALLRKAATGPDGIVPPAELLEEMGLAGRQLAPPPWVQAWIEADAARPWPPMQDG